MNITEEKLKENFSHNLACYRRRAGLTQLELAEKLNYSDKSVSKWERGEGLPDLLVVATIAELFGMTIDDMIGDKEVKKPLLHRNKIIITILSVGLVLLLAAVLFFVFELTLKSYPTWHMFVYALSAASIVNLVLGCCWWSKLYQFISVSLLIWIIPASVFVIVSTFYMLPKLNLIFIISGVLQIMTILWFLMKK
ncbi:MAG: helix-turn-helix transcriptional regulator [Clostridia bacterium]|nr:helix-turn-helix transcriptional regulator [Clostridia bacterium]